MRCLLDFIMNSMGTQSLSKNYQTPSYTYDTVEHQLLRKEWLMPLRPYDQEQIFLLPPSLKKELRVRLAFVHLV